MFTPWVIVDDQHAIYQKKKKNRIVEVTLAELVEVHLHLTWERSFQYQCFKSMKWLVFVREGNWRVNTYPFYRTRIAGYPFSSMFSFTSRRKKFLSRHTLPTNSTLGVTCGVGVAVAVSWNVVVLDREQCMSVHTGRVRLDMKVFHCTSYHQILPEDQNGHKNCLTWLFTYTGCRETFTCMWLVFLLHHQTRWSVGNTHARACSHTQLKLCIEAVIRACECGCCLYSVVGSVA
jgi:hypothetical protein